MISEITNRIINQDATIIQALKMMDSEKVKLLFVFDCQRFCGILTIGDIQRAIIKNVALSSCIVNILDINKKYAFIDDTIEQIKNKILSLRAECMPVVDNNGNLLKVYFWSDFFGDKNDAEDKRSLNIPVVIMAGGLGTRLKPLTNIIPKPLIPIGEKTIIETILDQFEAIGCSKFYLSVNYKSEVIEYYMSHLEQKYDVTFFKEDKPLGTIGSVSLLKGKIDKPFFVSNCDNLIDQDYRDVFDYHKENNNEITIVTSVKSYRIPYGVIETGENGIMKGISEKPEITYMINTGVYILNPELIDEIPQNEFFHITQLIEKVKSRNGRIGCFPVSEKAWTDIGEWDEYLKLIK